MLLNSTGWIYCTYTSKDNQWYIPNGVLQDVTYGNCRVLQWAHICLTKDQQLQLSIHDEVILTWHLAPEQLGFGTNGARSDIAVRTTPTPLQLRWVHAFCLDFYFLPELYHSNHPSIIRSNPNDQNHFRLGFADCLRPYVVFARIRGLSLEIKCTEKH